jgi:hypothetical protein
MLKNIPKLCVKLMVQNVLLLVKTKATTEQ